MAPWLTRFFRWWIAELTACSHDILARVAPKWRRVLTVHVNRERPLVIDGEVETGRRVRLVFDVDFAFVKQLELPLAALPHLKSALSLQFPKWLPMSPTLLATDYAVVAVHPERSAFDLELAAIKLTDIEPVATTVRQWGLRVSSVHLRGTTDDSVRFQFPVYNSSSRRFVPTRVDTWLLASAAILAIASIVAPAVQGYRAARALSQAQLQTVNEAQAAMEERQHLLADVDPLTVLASRERVVGAAMILSEVTTRIPQDTWLTTFELKGRNLRLAGLSPDAAAVVKVLSDSPHLAAVELRSSMTAGAGSGKDRFEVTAQVKDGA